MPHLNAIPTVFNPERNCGAVTRAPDHHPCRLAKGHGTVHPGLQRCKHHGGSMPAQVKAAQRETAIRAVERLGIPLGNGDPFVLLEHAVQHGEGQLSASAALVVEAAAKAADPEHATIPIVPLGMAAEMYLDAIRTAGRVGKQAVDAKVADRQQTLDMAMYALLSRFVTELFDRFLPEERRPDAEIWAKSRFLEMAGELETPGRPN